jgi:hypothetical protein
VAIIIASTKPDCVVALGGCQLSIVNMTAKMRLCSTCVL